MSKMTIIDLKEALGKIEHDLYHQLKKVEADFDVGIEGIELAHVREINKQRDTLTSVTVAVKIEGAAHG